MCDYTSSEEKYTECDCTEEDCIEDYCTEEYYMEEVFNVSRETIEVEPEEVSFFIVQMAAGLVMGTVNEQNIYEGMLEANCNNKEVAEYIVKRAKEEAFLFVMNNK